MKKLSNDQKFELEELIDRYGVDSLIDAIGDICMEKADHVSATYQDTELAKLWEKVGRSLDKASVIANNLPH